jgi:hypothetical protein
MTTYRATTVYLTNDQSDWLRRLSAQASLDGLSISGADVVRLALDRLRGQLDNENLRTALIEHIHDEAQRYPGRVKRGMPNMTMRSGAIELPTAG